MTIIPVAIEVGGGGLGMGTQPADPDAEVATTSEGAVVMGSGGGFGTLSFPLGRATHDELRKAAPSQTDLGQQHQAWKAGR